LKTVCCNSKEKKLKNYKDKKNFKIQFFNKNVVLKRLKTIKKNIFININFLNDECSTLNESPGILWSGRGAHNIAPLKVLTFPKRCSKSRVWVEISVMYCAGVTTDDVVFAEAVINGECILNLV